MTRTLRVNDFDLRHTLGSGQFFRYAPLENGWFEARTQGRTLRLRQEGNTLSFAGAPAAFIRRFLGIDTDLAQLRCLAKNDPPLANAMRAYPGLRVMRQDPWECLVGFVCSSASNIRKIQLNLRRIVEEFGNGAEMPRPGALNDMLALRRCSLGYRADYLHRINALIDETWLRALSRADYPNAKAMLVALPGIGEKIADCICLFALGHRRAFPVDVWVERVMREEYFGGETASHKRIRELAAAKWGDHAGLAQQYLYHWRRLR